MEYQYQLNLTDTLTGEIVANGTAGTENLAVVVWEASGLKPATMYTLTVCQDSKRIPVPCEVVNLEAPTLGYGECFLLKLQSTVEWQR